MNPMTQYISENRSIIHTPTIIHLAAEYNATRINGIQYSMNELMERYFVHKTWKDNPAYFERTQKQAELMSFWLGYETKDCSFFYDDVSQIPSGGTHSSRYTYEENVQKSIDYHVNLFETLRPEGVCVAGGLALESFVYIILPQLKHKPKFIIGMRNPSNQGHFGNPQDWMKRYEEAQKGLHIPTDGKIYKLTYKEHLQKFQFQTPHFRKSKYIPKTQTSQLVYQTKTPHTQTRTTTKNPTWKWEDFVSFLESKDIYRSKEPDSQSRSSFSLHGIELIHQVKRKNNGCVGAGYFSVAFADSQCKGFYYKGMQYKLDKAKHINIQKAIKNGHFEALLIETYNRKKNKMTGKKQNI